MKYNEKEIKELAVQIRKNILRTIASKGTGHVGGSLSIADALAVLYGSVMNIDPKEPEKQDRDYLDWNKVRRSYIHSSKYRRICSRSR